jgi:putative oxidoreductase
MKQTLASWEVYARSLMRIIASFVFILHGFRHFGYLLAAAGRGRAVPPAIDALPQFFGYLEIAGGILFLLGLFSRPVAAILCLEVLLAYIINAAPRGPWPIRNGGNETLLYFLVFLFIAIAGGGAWSLERFLPHSLKQNPATVQ